LAAQFIDYLPDYLADEVWDVYFKVMQIAEERYGNVIVQSLELKMVRVELGLKRGGLEFQTLDRIADLVAQGGVEIIIRENGEPDFKVAVRRAAWFFDSQ
jgi:hypothetical protein